MSSLVLCHFGAITQSGVLARRNRRHPRQPEWRPCPLEWRPGQSGWRPVQWRPGHTDWCPGKLKCDGEGITFEGYNTDSCQLAAQFTFNSKYGECVENDYFDQKIFVKATLKPTIPESVKRGCEIFDV